MTVSAMSALVLRDWLQKHYRAGTTLNAYSFQRQLAKSLPFAWGVATGSDSQFPTTEGAVSANLVAGLFQQDIERLIETSKAEAWIHVRFTEVAHMLKAPAAFFGVLGRQLSQASRWLSEVEARSPEKVP